MEENINYEDPENIEQHIERIKESPTMKDIFEIIKDIYPSWIVGLSHTYCDDYPNLKDNWEHICRAKNVKPQAILVVDEIYFDEKHKLLRTLCEVLTCTGFVVRRKSEIVQCSICSVAMPSENMFKILQEKGIPNIPNNWSPKCSGC
jgi:hypothetical protein